MSNHGKLVNLIAGYSGTGKDTLHIILKTDDKPKRHSICNKIKHILYPAPSTKIRYLIFSDINSQDIGSYLFECKSRTRIAQADPIKAHVNSRHNLPKDFDYEANKNKVLPSLDGQRLRDLYIEFGTQMRNININYWAKLAHYSIALSPTEIVDVTDFRFPNEYEYILSKHNRTVTTRIFRSEVRIPNSNVESEHALDNFTTNFLLVSSWSEFQIALNKFPQYNTHVYIGCINKII